MGAARWTQGGPKQDLQQFWSDFWTRVYPFLPDRFQVSFFHRFPNRNFDEGGLQNRGFRKEGFTKTSFPVVVFMNFGVDVISFFGLPWEPLLWFSVS